MNTSDSQDNKKFRDVSQVKCWSQTFLNEFRDSQSLAGMGVLATMASAISTLAERIEELESQINRSGNGQ